MTRNKPYAGGFITEHYGRPRNNVHAIQIEISRGLYADEAAFVPSNGFARMHDNLRRFVETFAADLAAEASRPAAAE